MLLGTEQIQELIKEGLVQDLCARELENPESVVLDLRLNKVFKMKGKAFLGIEERETPEMEEIAAYDPEKKSSVVIKPGEYVIAETIEKVKIPEGIFMLYKPRTTLHRMGIMMRGTIGDPGFEGVLHPALYNAGPCEVEIEMGARFSQVCFLKIDGKSESYRGQWQGGRLTTEGKEEQR
jgi:deoxycytidine triphosphate deaminase